MVTRSGSLVSTIDVLNIPSNANHLLFTTLSKPSREREAKNKQLTIVTDIQCLHVIIQYMLAKALFAKILKSGKKNDQTWSEITDWG